MGMCWNVIMLNDVIMAIVGMLQVKYGAKVNFPEYAYPSVICQVNLVMEQYVRRNSDVLIMFYFFDNEIVLKIYGYTANFSYIDFDNMFVEVDDLIRRWRSRGYVLERDYVGQ